MAAITSAQTGAWSSTSTWTGGTIPGNGDTVTIATTHVVTLTDARTVGADGGTGTTAITVAGTGQLHIDAELTCKGDLFQQRGSTVEIGGGGTLILDANTGQSYKWSVNTTGTGTAQAKITGTSWSSFGTVKSGSRGGYGWIDFYQDLSRPITVNFAYFKFLSLGTASVNAFKMAFLATPTHCTMATGVVVGSGQINLVNCAANGNMLVSYLSIVAPLDDPLRFSSAAAKTTGSRSVSNITVYNATGTYRYIHTLCKDVPYSNIVIYNIGITGSANEAGCSYDKFFSFTDMAHAFSTFVTSGSYGAAITNSVFIDHSANQHYITVKGGGAVVPTYSGNIFDGDGYFSVDYGDCYVPECEINIEQCIAINLSGVLATYGYAGAIISVNRCTGYGEGSYLSVGETTGAATQVKSIKNTLFVSNHGVRQIANFISQTGMTVDYNGSYNCEATNLNYPVGHPYAGQNSYMGAETYAAWTNPATTFGTDYATHDVVADPRFVDSTRTVRGYFGVASVQLAAREAVTINGWDYTGVATTPTTKTVDATAAYIREGFTPTNGLLKGAGEGGVDIGAVDVVPAGAYIKVAGVWTAVDASYVKVSSVWKPVTGTFIKVSGVWEPV